MDNPKYSKYIYLSLVFYPPISDSNVIFSLEICLWFVKLENRLRPAPTGEVGSFDSWDA